MGHGMGHVGRGVGGGVGHSMGQVGGGIGGGVGYKGSMSHIGRGISGSVSYNRGMGHVGRGHSLDNGGSERGLADDRVESVDGIGGVVDGASGAIGFGERVLASHHISVAGLVLVLVVSGHGILDVVGEGILGMGVVLNGL